MTLAVILALVAAGFAMSAVSVSARKKKSRVVNTSSARDDMKSQLAAASDLILELEPRVAIAERDDLKLRFAEASRTFSTVLDRADQAVEGMEIADLRIEIAKARWRLDVIDAELDGRTSPAEPHTRDNSGSAWDSSRGSGGADST